MTKYIINGGRPLSGEITVSGAKNAAVAILPAALLVNGVCRIENVPNISDVSLLLNIMHSMGARVRTVNKHTLDIDASAVNTWAAPVEPLRKMRASYYLIGAMLGRYGKASVGMPGGCDFGVRPIDQHLKGFTAMGARIDIQNGIINAEAEGGRLRGASVYLDMISVGATANIMMAAVTADGMTTIENAAKEPHIVDLANFLNSMGANIRGAGTDVIRVRGVESLSGGFYSIIPDQIEAGTYMAAVAAAGGDVYIRNVIPKHLESISSKFREMGVGIEDYGDCLRIRSDRKLTSVKVKTMPYPGFPTDMQPQIATVLCCASGTSVLTEGVYDNRFAYVNELRRMGASIQVDGKIAVIESVDQLSGAPVRACDLRAGAALVIAGLAAKGRTEVENVYHIERGYEELVEKLQAVGADVRRVIMPDNNERKSSQAG